MRSLFTFLALAGLAAIVLGGEAHAADVDQAIRTQVLQTYQLDPAWYQVDILSSQLHTTQLDPRQDISIRKLSEKEPIGLFSVILTISQDGRTVETGQVSLNIRKFAQVLVTQDNLLRHTPVSTGHLATERMDVTSLPEQAVPSLEAITGYRMKRNVGKGQILTFSAVEPIPDIEVGTEVTIVCSQGLLQVTVPGEAMQPGSTGDLVRVRNRASGKVLVARVINDKTVAIQP